MPSLICKDKGILSSTDSEDSDGSARSSCQGKTFLVSHLLHHAHTLDSPKSSPPLLACSILCRWLSSLFFMLSFAFGCWKAQVSCCSIWASSYLLCQSLGAVFTDAYRALQPKTPAVDGMSTAGIAEYLRS